ncbi:MAG: metallophosphoesterase [Bacteroidales bacterium]
MEPYIISEKSKSIYVCGDIHGDFKCLIGQIQKSNLENSVLIVAGDCGIGFEEDRYYRSLYGSLHEILEERQFLILLVRGNHDDPAYFDGKQIDYDFMKAIPDYSVIQTNDRNILCVGGAISVDRESRKGWLLSQRIKGRENARRIYWSTEAPLFDSQALALIAERGIKIDTVITHSAPSICKPPLKKNFYDFVLLDDSLEKDVFDERETLDRLRQALIEDHHPLRYWYYGHFHASHTEFIDSTTFILLDIQEIKEA